MKRILFLILLITLSQWGCGDSSDSPPANTANESGADTGGTESEEPLSCDAALTRLNETYRLARVCERDDDCNYIDGPFHGANAQVTRLEIIARNDQTREFALRDCVSGPAAMQFMVTGNDVLVENFRTRIETQAQNQQQACTEPNTVHCQAFTTATASPAPVCRAGQCSVP